MSKPVIELEAVSRTYGGAVPVHALRNASLRIDGGEFAAIVGPSGSGKSTMLGLLGLLDQPTTGVVRVGGRDMSRAGDGERTKVRGEAIGFVFQQFHLIPHLSAAENVETALSYRGLRPKTRRARALDALGRVGLADRADHLPVELSGGEQQRTAVARALVTDPGLILADEPTGALDTANAELVMELLAGIVDADRALVIVTHDLEIADQADRRITLRDGEIVSDVTKSRVGADEAGSDGGGEP